MGGSENEEGKAAKSGDGETIPDLDELEEFEDVADVFESTFNFRFEEPYVLLLSSFPSHLC